MRLFEHPDFSQAVLQAEAHFRGQGLRAAFIEKDYYVTEALRLIAAAAGDRTIFKGGTSLSKGWNLIQRFSEDIDIFFDPHVGGAPLGKRAIDRALKALRDAIAVHPALSFLAHESQTIGGFGRSDQFAYTPQFGLGDVAPRVVVETGTASGREPTVVVDLRSYLGPFFQEAGLSRGAEDEGAFAMRLLHFRRTFVEKLFAIHAKVELFKRDGRGIGTYARHYHDLFELAARAEVLDMLRTPEYAAIKVDYDHISRTHFPKSYFPPDEMSFARSEAFFPPVALAAALAAEYEMQCRQLYYGPYPAWTQVQERFAELRDLL